MSTTFIHTTMGGNPVAIHRSLIGAAFRYGDGSVWLAFKAPIALDPYRPNQLLHGVTLNATDPAADLWALALDQEFEPAPPDTVWCMSLDDEEVDR